MVSRQHKQALGGERAKSNQQTSIQTTTAVPPDSSPQRRKEKKKKTRKRMEEYKPLDQAFPTVQQEKEKATKQLRSETKTKMDLLSISDCTGTGEEKK